MVQGILNFEQYFRAFKEQYVIIGGTACDLLIAERGGDFRATKDLDMVLIVEALTSEFGATFWAFIREVGYKTWCRDGEKPQYYRFENPKNDQYPKIIELFSRKPEYILPAPDTVSVPIHFDDDTSSLSAILLDDIYYGFMCSGKVFVADVGIPVLDVPHLIVFKIRAWLDLTARKTRGEHVDSRNIRKHKNDVFRLAFYAPTEVITTVPAEIYTDIENFCMEMEKAPVDPAQLGVDDVTKEELLQVIRGGFVIGKMT